MTVIRVMLGISKFNLADVLKDSEIIWNVIFFNVGIFCTYRYRWTFSLQTTIEKKDCYFLRNTPETGIILCELIADRYFTTSETTPHQIQFQPNLPFFDTMKRHNVQALIELGKFNLSWRLGSRYYFTAFRSKLRSIVVFPILIFIFRSATSLRP